MTHTKANERQSLDPKSRIRKLARHRTFALLLVVFLLFGAVIVRLGQLQLVDSNRFQTIGESQRIRTVKLSADRGAIFDSNGRDLAQSVPQATIWADPSLVKNKFETAALLAPVLGKEVEEVAELLGKQGRFVYLARKVDESTAEKVDKLDLEGIAAYDEPKRFLTSDSLLSSVIGQVGVDNEGLSGLELQYEKQLRGTPGELIVEQDIGGRDIPGGVNKGTQAIRGNDLVLTIDGDLQFKVEESLKKEIELANAKGGMAAVMDTKTGNIVALSNLTANKGEGGEVGAMANNAAVTNVYEPGSTSKLITASAALEAGVVNPSTMFTVADRLQIYDSTFGDSEDHPTARWNTTDIITTSSNIGTIQIAQKLGKDKLDSFQRAFGYGSKTGLNYPGESAGLLLPPKKYSGTTLATTAIGQGVSVTAMQMLAAFNTIANDGVYVAPRLVDATIDANGKRREADASSTRRVVSSQTASQVNLMLQEVVRVGTATAAQVDGYEIAGKTGTARKPKANGIGYQNGAYISSFAGFLPAADPRFTAIVILDEPTPIYGGLVAAPVFSEIARFAVQRYGIAPAVSGGDRHGVPFAASSATSAHSSGDESTGLTAEDANRATAAANANVRATTSTTSPTSSTTSTKPSRSTPNTSQGSDGTSGGEKPQ